MVASLLTFVLLLFFTNLVTRLFGDFLTGLTMGMGMDAGPAWLLLVCCVVSTRATMSSNELLRRRRE